MALVDILVFIGGWVAGVLTVIGAEMVGLWLSDRRRGYRRHEPWD
jgi:hypothetical protein